MSIMSRSPARCLRKMVSLTHSFVAIISDSAELIVVQPSWRDLQERGTPHRVVIWPDIEQN